MDESMLQRLAERVDRLDQANRRGKRLGMAALFAGVLLAATGGWKLEETEILLRDPNNGKVRISLTTNPVNGSAGIQIFDRLGRRRILLATRENDDVPMLMYFDEEGNSKRQDRD